MYVEPRPLARQFLQTVAEIFTVYIYTAGEKKYADAVLNIIDPENHIQRRFYRDSCRKENGTIIKDLKHLRRTIRSKQEMILVDDNRLSIEKNYPFAIEAKAFEGEQDDR
jgi:TFIIF-interacting CTD phosphatase-like protein